MTQTAESTTDIVARVATYTATPVVTITDAVTLQTANGELKANKALQKEVTETFGPLKAAAKAAHQKICDEEARHLDPLKARELTIKTGIATYAREQERLAAEARRKAEAEAAAETKRLADEAARKAKEEQEARAAMMEDAGDALRADALRAEPVVVQAPAPVAPRYAPPPPPPIPKAAGLSVKKIYSAEVTDFMALVRYQLENPAMRVLEPNQSVLDQLARLNKDALAIPGVKVVVRDSVASR